MKHRNAALALAGLLVLSGGAFAALSKEEVKAEQDRIATAYKADQEKCGALKDNARDLCLAEAKGRMNVARAELDATRNPSDKGAQRKLQKARADAEYDVARQKCDALDGGDKKACRKDARAAHKLATGQAKKASERS
jgi:hypothetical protein